MKELVWRSIATIPIYASKHYCQNYCIAALEGKVADETTGTCELIKRVVKSTQVYSSDC